MRLTPFLAACGAAAHPRPASCPVELGLQDEVEAAARCTRTQALRIRTGASLDVAPLAALAQIDGDLDIGPTVAVDSIRLDGLVRVGGTIRIRNNGALRGVFLPHLESAGAIEVADNPVLSTVSFPRLTVVADGFVISNNNSLELVGAGALTSVGAALVIGGSPKLNLLELGHLARARSVRIEDVPSVPADVADALRAASSSP